MAKQKRTPSMTAMAEIRRAAIQFIDDAWRRSRYFEEYGPRAQAASTRAVLTAIFDLERALNPDRLPREHPERACPRVVAWPNKTIEALLWLRDLFDELVGPELLDSLATSATFEAWACNPAAPPVRPPITVKSLERFEKAVECLGSLNGWLASYPEVCERGDRIPNWEQVESPEEETTGDSRLHPPSASRVCPVVLRGYLESPLVEGQEVPPITHDEYDIIYILIQMFVAGVPGICELELIQQTNRNARKNLEGLRKKHPLWSEVILMSGKQKQGYRLKNSDLKMLSPGKEPALRRQFPV